MLEIYKLFFLYAVTVPCLLYYTAFCYHIECSVIVYMMYAVQGRWPELNLYHRQAGDGDSLQTFFFSSGPPCHLDTLQKYIKYINLVLRSFAIFIDMCITTLSRKECSKFLSWAA